MMLWKLGATLLLAGCLGSAAVVACAESQTGVLSGTVTIEAPAHDSILTQLDTILSKLVDLDAKLDALHPSVPSQEPIVSIPLLWSPPLPIPAPYPTAPVLTITQQPGEALDALRLRVRTEKSATPGPGEIHVIVNTDEVLTATITMSTSDSGTASNPIVYLSPPGGMTRLSGAVPLSPSAFVPVTDQAILDQLHPDIHSTVLQLDVTGFNLGSVVPANEVGYWPQSVSNDELMLYYQDTKMPVARWPNAGFTQIGTVVGGPHVDRFGYADPRIERWANSPDAYINGAFFYDYAWAFQPLAGVDVASQQILLENYAQAPIRHQEGFKEGQPYYALNILSELDSPGEWYVDRATSILYFLPPDPLTNQPMALSSLGKLLDINGASYVTFRGLVFEQARSIIVTIDGGTDVKFKDGVFRNGSSIAGVRWQGSMNPELSNTEVYSFSAAAVQVKGAGDRLTLTSGGGVIDNNVIADFGQGQVVPGIHLDGVGIHFAHNRVQHGPHTAIQMAGNNHLIEYNQIWDVVKLTGDAGAIYGGRDWTVRGHIIQYNHFKDIQPATSGQVVGVYMDDMESGWSMIGNIFERVETALLLGGGRDHHIENNIMVDTRFYFYADGRAIPSSGSAYQEGSSIRVKLAAMPYTTPPWSTQYPELSTILDNNDQGDPLNNVIRHTLVVGTGTPLITAEAQPFIIPTNTRTDLAVDSQFQLDAGALASFPEWQQLPFQQIGRIPDGN